jgi:hypothetical protein
MSAPRFLVAKYVADLRRSEPRNIGIIVWAEGAVMARFLERPKFVKDHGNYRDWVAFWMAKLEKSVLPRRRGCPPVAKASPDYLDAFRATARENYVLANGGYLLDKVGMSELQKLLDQLFKELVEDRSPEKRDDAERRNKLFQACRTLVSEAGLEENPNFRSEYPLLCPVGPGTTEQFCFSYAYGNGMPKRLYQKVHLPSKRSQLVQSRHHVAWMFKNVMEKGFVNKEDCAALVHLSEQDKENQDIEESVRVLGTVARVLNVREYRSVLKEFRSLKKLTLSNDTHGP